MSIIVSAYFKIPSKVSHDFYLEHLQRFLSGIKSHIDFFTTSDLVPLLTSYRGTLPITFHIINPLNDFVAFQVYGYDFWKTQCSIDIEKYHTPEVAAVWYEKKEFVKKIITIYKNNDPSFNKPIIWCDAGCVRDNKWLDIIHSFGKNTDNIPPQKLLMQTFSELPKNKEFYMYPDSYIAASIIAGYPDVWSVCSKLYDKTLVSYIMNNTCCNSDQYIWASTINAHPELFELIIVKECVNKWFYFLEYLSV